MRCPSEKGRLGAATRRIALAALASALVMQPALAADGATIFGQRCRMCHQAQTTPMGPSLKGVAGASIAGRPGYAYSAALKARAGVWTDGQLEAWLAGPAKFAPGAKMMISVPKPEDRAALVAHLRTLK